MFAAYQDLSCAAFKGVHCVTVKGRRGMFLTKSVPEGSFTLNNVFLSVSVICFCFIVVGDVVTVAV